MTPCRTLPPLADARRVYWERMIGFNRHWQAVHWRQRELPLVVHYAGCSFCSPPTDKLTEQAVTRCNIAFMHAYKLAQCELHSYYASGGLAGSRVGPVYAADGTRARAESQCRYYGAAKPLRRTGSPNGVVGRERTLL